MIKRLGKNLLCAVLERQVRALRRRHDFKVIAVAGSVGKTSTKLAVAELLSTKARVRYQAGNYNDRLTVPLIFFGEDEPGLFNVLAWLRLLARNRRAVRRPYEFDYVVAELGTDGPGQMAAFAYVQPDLSLLSGVAPEHMEFFKTLDAVADEETTLFNYSSHILVNADDVEAKYLVGKRYQAYGFNEKADYRLSDWQEHDLKSAKATLQLPAQQPVAVELAALGRQGAKISLAAAAVAHHLGFTTEEIVAGLKAIKPVAGRMQLLTGQNNSTIIDDTYNASPLATTAALDVLYAAPAEQRIAILGNMNELGDTSAPAHQAIGEYCDPKQLDLVVTIGPDANRYLAPAAQAQGCEVLTFDSPVTAGQAVAERLKAGTLVLAKGSQNGVFAEEAVKQLLANPADAAKLVRQSTYWLNIKRRQNLLG